MTSKRQFFKSGAMLAAVALAMRGVSLLFNSYITEKVGAEGMGLLSLTMRENGQKEFCVPPFFTRLPSGARRRSPSISDRIFSLCAS